MKLPSQSAKYTKAFEDGRFARDYSVDVAQLFSHLLGELRAPWRHGGFSFFGHWILDIGLGTQR